MNGPAFTTLYPRMKRRTTPPKPYLPPQRRTRHRLSHRPHRQCRCGVIYPSHNALSTPPIMSDRIPTQPTTRHSRRGRTGRETHDVEADVDEGDPQAQTATKRAEHAPPRTSVRHPPAVDWNNKVLHVLEFKRKSDQRHTYRERGESRARAQHDVLVRNLAKMAGEAEGENRGWKIKLMIFVGGTCGSVHTQTFNKISRNLGLSSPNEILSGRDS